MRLRRSAYVFVVLLAGAGCSDAGAPAPPASDSSSAATAAPSPSGSAATRTPPEPPVGTRPVVDCLNGTYRLTRTTDVADGAAYAEVSGGDVELRFTGKEFPDGNYVGTAYRLQVAGKRPLALVAPDGTRSSLVASVRATGSYALEDSRATFARQPGTGSGRLTTGGATTTLGAAQVQAVVAPVGLLTVSCTKTTLWLTGDTVQHVLKAV